MKAFLFLRNIILLYSLFTLYKNTTLNEELVAEIKQNPLLLSSTNQSEQTEKQSEQNSSANTLQQKIQPPDYYEKTEIEKLKSSDQFNKLPKKEDY